jgi:hypothetical protein
VTTARNLLRVSEAGAPTSKVETPQLLHAARTKVAAPQPRPSTWTVRLVDSGHELGAVEAQSYEEALGKAIRLAARSELPPQALHVQRQDERN